MRVGIVSDIHSNLFALEVVLERLERLSPEIIVCAGDVVGYGAHPNECCRMIAESSDHVIRGNHDAAALSEDISSMNPYAAAASVWTSERLDTASRSFLESLPSSSSIDKGGTRLSMFHGSDRDCGEYVYEEHVDSDMLRRCGGGFVVLGHTHIPFVRTFPEGTVVNPGAVGQPRDGDPRASFALLDTGTSVCDIIREEYPVREASEAILKAGLPMMLAMRLSVGK
jgi:putative phosphoesterase